MNYDIIIKNIRNNCAGEQDYNDLLEAIKMISGGVAKNERAVKIYSGNSTDVNNEGMEFLIHLIKGGITGRVVSKQDISREFRRWRMIEKAPADYDLFMILSKAMLELEKDGEVLRLSNNTFRNGGSTIWALPGLKDKIGSVENYQQKCKEIGTYRTNKINSSIRQGKMISPPNARMLVIQLLQCFGGSVAMSNIIKAAKNHLCEECFPKIIPESAIKDSYNTDEDSLEDAIQTRFHGKTTPLTEARARSIEFESDTRASTVWDQISGIMQKRTGKVDGHKVLCLYLLPKYLSDSSKPVMDDLGPTSTVENINREVMSILKTTLKVEKIDADAGFSEDFITFLNSVQHKTIAKINKKCRENNMDNSLYIE